MSVIATFSPLDLVMRAFAGMCASSMLLISVECLRSAYDLIKGK